ncbi:MAG: response regulator [Oscillospiraceae bacterium]
MNAQKIVKALSYDAVFSQEFDVTTGIVDSDIISADGTNYTQKAGLSAPCAYNDLVAAYFAEPFNCRILSNSKIRRLSCELLQDCYLSGNIRCEVNLIYPATNAYYRILFFLYEDEISGHIMAFMTCRILRETENEIYTASGEIKNRLQEKNETFYKKIMDEQSCGVFAYTVPGYQIVTANAEALRMFNSSSIDDMQQNILDVINGIYYPVPDTFEKLKSLRTEDSSVDYECIFNKGKENEFYVIAKTKVIYSPNGIRIIYSTYVDATEMHALQDSVEKAEQGVKAKAEFLFNMSHDLRTPMNAIIGYTELLQSHRGEAEAESKYLTKLMDSSKFLMFLLNNAIELASLENGNAKLKESLANAKRFNDMLDSVIESSLKERNLHFTRTVNIEHYNVMCDTAKMRVIFLNLISNAIKYTPSGGSISMDLQEIPSDREGYALYKTVITDTGIGISPDFLPHIYENFSRAKNSSLSGIYGAGLGMPVVKKLLDIMDGTISIESGLGKGTKVTVIIPHRIVEREELYGLTKGQSTYDRKLIEGKRILLAEDNELNAEIAIIILTEAGFICDHVMDGTEAVAAIETKPEDYYDLVLMDIQMPIMDGYKATGIIRQLEGRKAKIPIVAITANALEEDRRMALAAGMDGHISKPIDVSKLMDTLFGLLS